MVTLRSVADHVRLSPGTVSAVLNDAPSAQHLPQHTRERVMAAARELNYRPNFFARSLRKKRTFTIGVIANDIGDGYSSLVVGGIENYSRQKDYFFVTGVHHHNPQLFERYSRLLMERGVEGFITVDWNMEHGLPLPSVAVSGHRRHKGVTNVILDHGCAARLALSHLVELGHREIAIMRGAEASSDSDDRWHAIRDAARDLGIQIRPELTVQLNAEDATPNLGYPYAKELLARNKPFTALFAFNDISAIGAMRAFQEAGRRVPADISVVGFDDIQSAAFQYPSLTTVRQPLFRMGEIAAQTLVERIEGSEEYPPEIAVEPELIVRESTAPPRA